MKLLTAALLTALGWGPLGCAQQPTGVAAPKAETSAAATPPPTPLLLTLEPAALALSRQRLAAGDATLQAPFAALKRRADQALQTPSRSVTHKTAVPPSGSKNDYMSMGPYWWPNPNTANGLPYVQRDGQRNPESAGNALDSIRLQRMLADVRDLALVYHFTGDARYARKAAADIRTWFLDPATRMNPHLRYGQAVPGIAEGRGIGIIDTRDLWFVIDAVALIAPERGALAPAEFQALRRWFADYAEWLATSPLGRDEAAAKNNHGMFFDVQLAAYWLFIGETEKARRLVFDAQTRRFAAQIDANGRMPLELARTRPYHYHTFTLEAATRLARYGQVLASIPNPAGAWPANDPRCRAPEQHLQCPLDLWRLSVDGKSLRGVLDFVAATVLAPAAWPYATALEPAPVLAPALPVLLFAQPQYAPGSFAAPLAALQRIAPDDVAWLMWPPR
jgi:hypothetical protein